MDFVRYIKKKGHRDPSSRAGSTTYRARLKPKKIDEISLDAIEQSNQQDNQMGGGLVGTKEERDEAERKRLASPTRDALESSGGVAAANFADRHLTHFDESRYDKPQYIIDRERAMAAANQTLKERNVHTPLITHLGEPVVYERTPPENAEIIEDYIAKPPKPTKPPIKDDYIKVKKPEEADLRFSRKLITSGYMVLIINSAAIFSSQAPSVVHGKH
mgnify:CR=1 FL=1